MNILKSLWAYRGFILGSVKREFQSKYRNSLLGAAWTVINPLAMIVVYTVIFSQLMHSRLPVVVANAALNFAIIFGLFTLFLLVSGNFPGLVFLAVVPLLASVSAFAIGLGMRLFRRHAGDMVDEL